MSSFSCVTDNERLVHIVGPLWLALSAVIDSQITSFNSHYSPAPCIGNGPPVLGRDTRVSSKSARSPPALPVALRMHARACAPPRGRQPSSRQRGAELEVRPPSSRTRSRSASAPARAGAGGTTAWKTAAEKEEAFLLNIGVRAARSKQVLSEQLLENHPHKIVSRSTRMRACVRTRLRARHTLHLDWAHRSCARAMRSALSQETIEECSDVVLELEATRLRTAADLSCSPYRLHQSDQHYLQPQARAHHGAALAGHRLPLYARPLSGRPRRASAISGARRTLTRTRHVLPAPAGKASTMSPARVLMHDPPCDSDQSNLSSCYCKHAPCVSQLHWHRLRSSRDVRLVGRRCAGALADDAAAAAAAAAAAIAAAAATATRSWRSAMREP